MSLSAQEIRLAQLSVTIALGEWATLAALRRAAPAGEPDRAWREAVLQCHLFAGFPRLVEAFEVLERNGGLGQITPAEVLSEPDMPERGAAFFERIYGKNTHIVRAKLGAYHPDFAAWILGHAYGRVLTRPGLDPRVRELLAVAALAALGQERQLASHLRGALQCGATRADLAALLAEISGLLTTERNATAQRVLAIAPE